MKSYSPKEVIKILKKHNWILDRIKGDHYIFKKENEKTIVVIPIGKKNIKIGTLKNIEKQSGIKFE